MTGRDLVAAALRKIGVQAPGESLDATEATDGLSELNRMLGSWSNEGLLIHTIEREEHAFTPSDQRYSMGPDGADFEATRPIAIENALVRDETNEPALEFPIRIVTKEEWVDILLKEIESTYPYYLYVEHTYPDLTLNFYPMPSAAHGVVLYCRMPLTEIEDLDTEISLPPGYEDALIYNLALRLAPEYGRQVDAMVMKTAQESLASIKRVNHRPRYLRTDDALVPRGHGYDIFSGGYR